MLGIVGLQWPEDSDCSQFPEEGGNASCLLPEDGVDGTTPGQGLWTLSWCGLVSVTDFP